MIRSVRVSGERLRRAAAGAIRAIRAQDKAAADLAFEHGKAVGAASDPVTRHASRVTRQTPTRSSAP